MLFCLNKSNCHLPVVYGRSEEEEKKNWCETLKVVANTFGDRVLASEYMNPKDKDDRKFIRIPDLSLSWNRFSSISSGKTHELRTFGIYNASSVRMFGTKDMESHEVCWRAAVESAGLTIVRSSKNCCRKQKTFCFNVFRLPY